MGVAGAGHQRLGARAVAAAVENEDHLVAGRVDSVLQGERVEAAAHQRLLVLGRHHDAGPQSGVGWSSHVHGGPAPAATASDPRS